MKPYTPGELPDDPPYTPYTPTDSCPPLSECLGHLAAHTLPAIRGPLWMLSGVLLATAVFAAPGCVSQPGVSLKATASVRETGAIVAVGGHAGDHGASVAGAAGQGGGRGELAANVEISINWPGK